MHCLEAVSRRQRRVNCSTFAAEINGLADALEPAKLVAMQYMEILCGTTTAHDLNQLSAKGEWPLCVEAVVDAKSVFDSITSVDAHLPTEESLIAVLMAIREQFAQRLMQRLWWCDTNDMLADALTKGAIAREPLLKALSEGLWILLKATKSASVKVTAVPSR